MGIETLAMLGVGMAVAGGGLQIAGGYKGAEGALLKGQAEEFAYQAKSQAASYNAAVSRTRAAAERDAAAAEAQDIFRHGEMQTASATAARGATGITMEGSPLLVSEAQMREVALGALRTIHTGQKRGTTLENEADLYNAEAKNAVTAGQYARNASYINADASILSGYASAFGTGANLLLKRPT